MQNRVLNAHLANLPFVPMRQIQVVVPVRLHGVVAVQRAYPPQEFFLLGLHATDDTTNEMRDKPKTN